MIRIFFRIILLALLPGISQPLAAAAPTQISDQEIYIKAHDGIELSVTHYPARGKYLIIWIASSYGLNERAYTLAHQLALKGVEVWQLDLASNLFQTPSSNFMRSVNAGYIADLIDAAYNKTQKKIILLSRAYGAIPTLRGAHIWQTRHPGQANLAGAILFSPDLYAGIPELGLEPDYLPIVTATNIPLVIFQGERRGTRWQLPRLLKQLHHNNEKIYLRLLKGVSGVFYRDDNQPETLKIVARLPEQIPALLSLLEHTVPPANAIDLKQFNYSKAKRLNSKLTAYQGNPQPLPLNLSDVQGQPIRVENYKNKITIVNFWASWCPPCVEEIPSLNRLKQQMRGYDFELISINYVETAKIVMDFMRRVKVDFSVLMDLDGSVARNWNVVAFPSTFIIGPDGKIKYGVNAAIDWDSKETVSIIQSLAKP